MNTTRMGESGVSTLHVHCVILILIKDSDSPHTSIVLSNDFVTYCKSETSSADASVQFL